MAARDNGTKQDIMPAQARAARALIGWSQDELAAFSNIPKRTIVRFEASVGVPRRSTIAAFRPPWKPRASSSFLRMVEVLGSG